MYPTNVFNIRRFKILSSSIVHHLLPFLPPTTALALVILDRQGTVRVHSELMYHYGATMKLFYILQWLDNPHRGNPHCGKPHCGKPGSDGRVVVPFWLLCALADLSDKRIWQLLREARGQGLIRSYQSRKGKLTVYLGSQYKAVRRAGLERLGAVTRTNKIFTLFQLKEVAISAASYHYQRQARQAVLTKFPESIRETAARYSCDKFLDNEMNDAPTLTVSGSQCEKPQCGKQRGNGQASFSSKENPGNPTCGKPILRKPFPKGKPKKKMYHVSQRKIFCGKSVIVYGTSQENIAWQLNCSVDTVQRHQIHLNKRQVCQSLGEYRTLVALLELDDGRLLDKFEMGHVLCNPIFGEDGRKFTLRISTHQPHQLYDTIGERDRFFRKGKHCYLAMTNLYYRSTEVFNEGMPAMRKAYYQFFKKNLNRMPTISPRSSHSPTRSIPPER